MAAKRLLVTGAAGFIGHWAALALKRRGDYVIGLDNFNSYYSPELKHERKRRLQEAGVTIVPGDIKEADLLNRLVEEHKITHILHLAAQAGVRYSLIEPYTYLSTNVDGFVSILELCRRYPHLYLAYASSSSVYGPNSEIPFKENDRADTQTSLYGVTKRTNELLARSYAGLFGIRSTGLRFFTVYGPWGRPDMAYYHFAQSIVKQCPIALYNQGEMWRDFTYIEDIIKGTLAAIDLEAQLEIFNLGNHHPESVKSLIEYLELYLGRKAILEFLPMQPGELQKTWADLTHSQKHLQFYPKVSLKEGIKRFVDWFYDYHLQPLAISDCEKKENRF